MTNFSSTRILAISGSLRMASSNTKLLQAAALLAPNGVEISIYEGLGELPHFNPDLENAEIPAVVDFRFRLRNSNGVLISTPEYAHSLPGVLKNALDWVVGSGELVDKPVALFNASPRSTYAQAALTEILSTMSACLITEAHLTIPILGKPLEKNEIVKNVGMANPLREAIQIFVRSIEAEKRDDFTQNP